MVVIRLQHESCGCWRPTEAMPRWIAEWLLANIIAATGYFRGERVLAAILEPRWDA